MKKMYCGLVNMRRKYIVAVLLLLSFGVMSTLALSYTQTDLTENWDTIYTLQYGESDLSLTEPTETDLILSGTATDGELQVSIPATTATAVTPKFTIEPLDSGGSVMSTDDTISVDVSVSLWDGVSQIGSTQTDTISISGTETDIEGVVSFSGISGLPSSAIDKIVIKFDCDSSTGFGTSDLQAFEEVYEQLRITIEDA